MNNNHVKTSFMYPLLKTILHLAVAFVIWIGSQIPGLFIYSVIPQQEIAQIVFTIMQIALVCGLLFLYLKYVGHITLNDCRITRIQIQLRWVVCAFLLPLAIVVFYLFVVPGDFIVHQLPPGQLLNVLVTGVFGSCIAAAVTEEMIFRGFAMKMLERQWGKTVAIVIPSLLFGLAHVSMGNNLQILDVILLILSGTSVGIMFSMITYQTGSIWSSVVVHGLWNLRSTFVGISTMLSGDYELSTIVLSSKSVLLTGGAWGIESSVPAIICYWIVIMIATYMIKKAKSDTYRTLMG